MKLVLSTKQVLGLCLVLFLFMPVGAVLGASQGSGASAGTSGQAAPGANDAASGSLPAYVPRSSAPSQSIYVVGGGSLNYEVEALEGLVARTQPQIFLSHSANDKSWLDFSTQQYGLKTQSISQTSALQTFKSVVTDGSGKVKIVLYSSNDPIAPAQLNMARTLAGVYGALPVSSSELKSVQSVFGSSDIDTLYNLQGMFTDKVSAYTWLWNTVGASVTKSVVAISPGGDLGLTDYIVEHSVFVFDFSQTTMTSQQSAEATKILSNYKQGTPVVGFFGLGKEPQTISFLSPLGFYMIPCDQVSNLSFFSGLPEATNLQQASPSGPVTYSKSKIYLSIQFSQGNSLQYLLGANKDMWTAVDSQGTPIRSELPETWQINPVAAELAPPILEYWYQTMYPDDYFIASTSDGAGYVHPDQLPNLASYLSLANQFNANANLNEMIIATGTNTNQVHTSLYQQIVADAPSTTAIFCKVPHNVDPVEVSGVPVFSMTYKAPQQSTWTTSDITSAVKSINSLANSGQFIWVYMDAQNPGPSFLLALVKALGSNYVPLRADQFAEVYQQSIGA